MSETIDITDGMQEEAGQPTPKKSNTLNPGINIKFFRTKKGATILELVQSINKHLEETNIQDLSDMYKFDYKEFIAKPVTVELMEEWEKGKSTPQIIIYFAAKFLNLGTEWLTDHIFDIFEGNDFVQYGGISYNNWKNIQSLTINHPTKELSEAYFNYMDRLERFYERQMENLHKHS